MEYITQGVVGSFCKKEETPATNTDPAKYKVTFTITPSQDYSIKHGVDVFTVFLINPPQPPKPTQSWDAKLKYSNDEYTCDPSFEPFLLALLRGYKAEFVMDFPDPADPDKHELKSIRLLK